MNKKTSSRLIACVAAVSLALSSMMATVWAADPAEAQFVARDGGETVSANDDGSVTVTTPDNSAGGGVKSAKAHAADGLTVTLDFDAETAAEYPTKPIFMLSYTDIQHATPNGTDESRGFFFQYDLNESNGQIVANIFPRKKTTAGQAGTDFGEGKSVVFDLTGPNTFTLTKQADGKYSFSHNGTVLFSDLDLADVIPVDGLYVNNYVAAYKDAGVGTADYTISVASTEAPKPVNGFIGINGVEMTASGDNGVSFTTLNASGVATDKRVKLDGLTVSITYSGCASNATDSAADPDIYRLSFTNLKGGNIGDSAIRQKGFYVQFANYNNLGVAEGAEGKDPANTGGISIYEAKKRDVNENSEPVTVFNEGRHLTKGSVFNFTFEKVEGNIYKMTYTDDHNQTEAIEYISSMDLTDCIDEDGCVYLTFLAAAMSGKTDNEVVNTIAVDGEYTDAPAEEMPPIVEEGEYYDLTDANGFTFTNLDETHSEEGKVFNAEVTPYSYNGYSIAGRSLRVLAQSKEAWTLDGLEFSITAAAPIPAGAFYQIALTKAPGMLEREDAAVNQGLILTVQHATADGTIYTYAWTGAANALNKDGADATVKPQFDAYHAGDTLTCKFMKNEDGTYNYMIKSNDGNYEAMAVNIDMSQMLNEDGKVYINLKVANTTQDLSYDFALLNVPMPKEEAQAAIDETESLVEADFTAESWAAFAAARDALQAAIDSDVEFLNDLYNDFVKALNALENIDPFEVAYEELLSEIEKEFATDADLKEDEYTAESWKAFSDAKAALETALNDGSGYDTLKDAFDAYLAAKKALATGSSTGTGVAAPIAAVTVLMVLSGALVLAIKKKKA